MMNEMYLVLMYGPVALMFFGGLGLLLVESSGYKFLAVVLPVLLAGAEILVLTQVGIHDLADFESELPTMLFVQSGALGIVAFVFMVVLALMLAREHWREYRIDQRARKWVGLVE